MEIPFHKPFMTQDEVSAAAEVIRGGWTTMGPQTVLFEKKFEEFAGKGEAAAVNSCTAALHLSLLALGIGPGDEVIVPAITFASSASAVIYTGARPVFADVEKDTHCISPADLEKKITAKTKAVIPVHFAGHPCDLDAVESAISGRNIRIIHDAAHCIPSKYKGETVGLTGAAACFSFYATKTLSAGEGGMILSCDEKLIERVKRLRLHGITKDAWKRYTAEGSWQYDLEELGYKYNANDISSAIGLQQLAKTEDMYLKRKNIAERYTSAFRDVSGLIPYVEKDYAQTSWHLYPLKIDIDRLTISRDRFIEELKSAGISTSVHFIPLYRFSYYKDSGYSAEHFPGCEYVFARTISLPIYPAMTDDEISYVSDTVVSIAGKYRKRG